MLVVCLYIGVAVVVVENTQALRVMEDWVVVVVVHVPVLLLLVLVVGRH
jgi:hypothetical protein